MSHMILMGTLLGRVTGSDISISPVWSHEMEISNQSGGSTFARLNTQQRSQKGHNREVVNCICRPSLGHQDGLFYLPMLVVI